MILHILTKKFHCGRLEWTTSSNHWRIFYLGPMMQSLPFKPAFTHPELVQVSLGYWWEDPMHTFKGGMISLPWAFIQQDSAGLYEEVCSGATAWKVECHDNSVSVHYITDASLGTLPVAMSLAQHNVITGDAVIITLPLNIICQLNFQPPLNSYISGSIADVYYYPSTKIMLQC